MTTRRDFLKTGVGAAAGIVFCSCGLQQAAQAQGQPTRKTLPVSVNGKKVKVIDVHSHCHFREAGALLGDEGPKVQVPPVNGAENAFIEVEKRLAAMDSQAVDMEVLSINPFWYGRDRDLAAKIVKIQNEKLAELCASKPDRFVGNASLTLQAPDLAVQELETAVKKQGLKGVAIGDRVGDMEFSDPKLHPVWAKAEELGAPLFIHPQAQPELNKRLAGNGWLSNAIGNPLGTTIALSHMIFEGTFDRFPGLKVIAAHGGGYLGSYADRSDHACLVGPKGCNPDIKLKKKPTEYLKQIYFDSLIFEPEAIRHLVAQVGASQIVLGSDYPYEWEMHPVDPIFATEQLSDDQKADILGRTAAKLFGVEV
jgi:predicted TIM-barrel fold metal-dependent hydrolase